MTGVPELATRYLAGPTLLGRPSCRFSAFAIVPNCGGSGEMDLPSFESRAHPTVSAVTATAIVVEAT
jgi:hypothetical protein